MESNKVIPWLMLVENVEMEHVTVDAVSLSFSLTRLKENSSELRECIVRRQLPFYSDFNAIIRIGFV